MSDYKHYTGKLIKIETPDSLSPEEHLKLIYESNDPCEFTLLNGKIYKFLEINEIREIGCFCFLEEKEDGTINFNTRFEEENNNLELMIEKELKRNG